MISLPVAPDKALFGQTDLAVKPVGDYCEQERFHLVRILKKLHVSSPPDHKLFPRFSQLVVSPNAS